MATYQITAIGQFDTIKASLVGGDVVDANDLPLGETWTVTKSGSSGSPITLQEVDLTGGAARAYCIDFTSISYLTLKDLIVRNATTRNIWSDSTAQGITIENLQSIGGAIGLWMRSKSNSTFRNITVSGQTGAGFYLSNAGSNITVDTLLVTGGNGGTDVLGSIALHDVVGLTADDIQSIDAGRVGISIRAGSGVIDIDGITATGSDGTTTGGIVIDTSTCSAGSHINDLVSTGHGAKGLYVNNSNFANCTGQNWDIESCNNDAISFISSQFGVVTGLVAKNNTLSGVISRGTSSAAVLESGEIGINGYDGLSTSDSSKIEAYRCRVYQNGTNENANSGDGVTAHNASVGNAYAYNLIYNNKNSALAVIGTSSGVFHHNTCVNNHSSGFVRGSLRFATIGSTLGWTCKNNIIVNTTTGDDYAGVLVMIENGADIPTLDYNLYWSTNPTPFWVHNGGTAGTPADYDKYNFAGWKTYSSQDAHSIFADPKLNADYTVPDTSRACNSGVSISGLNDGSEVDIFGNTVTTYPNIGADQGAGAGFGPWSPFATPMSALALSPDCPGDLRSVQCWSKVASAKEIERY